MRIEILPCVVAAMKNKSYIRIEKRVRIPGTVMPGSDILEMSDPVSFINA